MNMNFPSDILFDTLSLTQILTEYRKNSVLLYSYPVSELMDLYNRYGNFDHQSGCFWVSNERVELFIGDIKDRNLLDLVDAGYINLIWCENTKEISVATNPSYNNNKS
jgi:hypothetical protein